MNTNLIPDLPFKFKIDSEQTWTVISTGFDDSGWAMYDIVRDYDDACCTVSAVTLMTKLKFGEWKIVKTTKEKLESIINNEGQRALDYLKEKYMNKGFTKADLKDGMICTIRAGKSYTVKGSRMIGDDGVYIFIGNINDDLTVSGLSFLDIVSVQQTITVFERVDEKQLAIQKELEFAKAKAERLAAHISVLESKIK